MVTQELIDSINEGYFDDEVLNPINFSSYTLDTDIDEYYDAEKSFVESALFFESVDSLLEDYTEEEYEY